MQTSLVYKEELFARWMEMMIFFSCSFYCAQWAMSYRIDDIIQKNRRGTIKHIQKWMKKKNLTFWLTKWLFTTGKRIGSYCFFFVDQSIFFSFHSILLPHIMHSVTPLTVCYLILFYSKIQILAFIYYVYIRFSLSLFKMSTEIGCIKIGESKLEYRSLEMMCCFFVCVRVRVWPKYTFFLTFV